MNNMNYNEEMEMPCPCSNCGEWFDLNDGRGSEKWYPNTVICSDCARLEEKEIEHDQALEQAECAVDDYQSEIEGHESTLAELKNEITEVEGYLEIAKDNLETAKKDLQDLKSGKLSDLA